MDTKKPTAARSKQANAKPAAQPKPPRSGSTGDRYKTVVRRLPPNLPEDVFWNSVRPWATDETTTWKVFYPGKLKKGSVCTIYRSSSVLTETHSPNKENRAARAYIAFKNAEYLANFSRDYDGHIFRDKQGSFYFLMANNAIHPHNSGNETQAVVEFAPYQKVPLERKKPDTRHATIEQGECLSQRRG